MAITISLVNPATDTFQVWVNRTNETINALAQVTLTTAANTAGANVTGNTYVVGIIGANTLAANTIHGGNVSAMSTLAISTNVACAANLSVNEGGLIEVGNATVNVVVNSSSVVIGPNVTIDTVRAFFGNSTANTHANSLGFYVDGVAVPTSTGSMTVANDDVLIGSRARINFIEGANAVLSVTDDAGGGQINVIIDALGAGSGDAGGSDTHVQFNDSDVFAGNAGFTYTKTTNTVFIGNTLNLGANVTLDRTHLKVGTATINSTVNSTAVRVSSASGSANVKATQFEVGTSVVNATTITTRDQSYTNGNILTTGLSYNWTGTLANTVDSFTIAGYRAAEYFYSIKDNTANVRTCGHLHVLNDGTNGLITDFGVIESNGTLGTWSASQNSTHILVQYTSSSTDTTVKGYRTLIPV